MEMADLAMRSELRMRPELGSRMLAVLSAQLLALPADQLDERLERELAENPALEVTGRCAWCGRPSARRRCARCRAARPGVCAIPATGSHARQHLLAESAAALPEMLRPVLEVVVESLDEHGLLTAVTREELCRAAGCTATSLERVLSALRAAGPPGLAAFDVRGCLLAQLEAVADVRPGERWTLARELVDAYLPDLAEGREAEVAVRLGVPEGAVRDAVTLIRRQLSPYPAVELSTAEGSRAPLPEVVYRRVDPHRGEATLAVEVHDPWEGAVRVCADLAAMQSASDPAARAFARDRVAAARLVVTALDRRRGALRRVAVAVAEHHRDALLRGSSSYTALSRRDVAKAVGLHESTVSRAVKDSSVQLPCGRVVPFAQLFGSGLEARRALAELLAAEGRHSDRELAELLAARGFDVARRTVAKYRIQLAPSAQPARRKIASVPAAV
jgi:RNA polymerase sigma-54 factor